MVVVEGTRSSGWHQKILSIEVNLPLDLCVILEWLDPTDILRNETSIK